MAKLQDRFKDHPALGHGAVEESGVVPGPSVGPGPSGLAGTEQEEDVATPESSRPPSRAAVESVGDSEEEEEEEEEEDIALPASKKSKKTETPLVARVGKKNAKEQERHSFCLHTLTCRSRSSTNSGRSNMKARCRSKP